MLRPHRWFHIGLSLSLFWAAAVTFTATLSARSFVNAGGRIIEYADGDEEFAMAFAARIDQVYAPAVATLPVPTIELPPNEFMQHRDAYVAAIGRYLNLPHPTPQMTGVLARSQLPQGQLDAVGLQARSALRNFQVWREADLKARLVDGETVPGFIWRADTQTLEIKPPKNLADFVAWALPVVIDSREQATGTALVEKKLAEARQTLLAQAQAQSIRIGMHALLKEVAETALVENYLSSKDRRWFCEGVACYVAYKVIEDKVGPEAALRYYDIDAQLPLYGDVKQVSNLEKWVVVEDQPIATREMRANKANAVFSAEVIFNLAAQHGPEFLPRLMAEIGKTRRDKANMKTVYRAYKTLYHEELRTYLPNVY